ncbi:hypothetical protein [Burkholderia ambifaria]|uniref:hypothetical protein n=1 Tax=Burkholderia ambifaria TaxID=152480 RepID=UPI00158F4F8A|nr:hypothetical protein [Burkholderia ambifaria]
MHPVEVPREEIADAFVELIQLLSFITTAPSRAETDDLGNACLRQGDEKLVASFGRRGQ